MVSSEFKHIERYNINIIIIMHFMFTLRQSQIYRCRQYRSVSGTWNDRFQYQRRARFARAGIRYQTVYSETKMLMLYYDKVF